jgi:cyanophycinase-like exopeptidase
MKKYLLGWIVAFAFQYAHAQSYVSFFTGDTTDAVIAPQGGLVLMGGGGENDSAMAWFLRRAAGGDVVVLRTSGGDGYNTYLYSQLGVAMNSVHTLLMNNRSASSDPFVIHSLLKAEAIWLAGGNQATYIDFWKGTPVDSIINYKLANQQLVIGGISAGMAVMGGGYFSAANGSVTSAEALANPLNAKMMLGNQDFLQSPLPSVPYLITDTHYDNPDRKGRHVAFLAHALQQFGWPTAVGIGAEEYAAVCIEPNGWARVFGEYPQYDDFVWFVRPNCPQPLGPEVFTSGQPLVWNRNQAALKVYKVAGNMQGTGTFNLQDWTTGSGGTWEDWYVQQGVLTELPGAQPPACSLLSLSEGADMIPSIYPQPANHVLHLQWPQGGEVRSYQWLDGMGRVLLEASLPEGQTQLNLDELSAGNYILLLHSEKGTTAHKVLITRN